MMYNTLNNIVLFTFHKLSQPICMVDERELKSMNGVRPTDAVCNYVRH